MANIVLGSLVSDIRGSVATETYLRTPAGLVVRERVIPSQPPSAKRDQAQANFTAVTQAWSGRLSEAQRQAWRAYGIRYPRPNVWGDPIINSGYLAYVRCNCALKRINSAWWIDEAPELGMLPMPPFTLEYLSFVGVGEYSIYPAEIVPKVVDYYLIISIGKTVNEGVSYYSTPWQTYQTCYWQGEFWEPSMEGVPLPEWSGTKDRLFCKAYLFDKTTGRISVPFQAFDDVQIIG